MEMRFAKDLCRSISASPPAPLLKRAGVRSLEGSPG